MTETYEQRMDRFLCLGIYARKPVTPQIVSVLSESDQEIFEIPLYDWAKEKGFE